MTDGLNLGSGPWYAEGWTNVDLRDPDDGSRGPDVYASIFDLAAFEDGTFHRAYLGHVLEHLEWERIPDALAEVRRVLVPGGTVMVVGPCILRAIATRQPTDLLERILARPWGSGEGQEHAWTPTTAWTLQAMKEGGLEGVREIPVDQVVKPEWPNPSTASWQMAAFGFA